MVAPARCLILTAHQSTRFVGLWRHSCTVRSVAEESSSSSSSLDVGDDEVIPETAILPEKWSVKMNDSIGKRREEGPGNLRRQSDKGVGERVGERTVVKRGGDGGGGGGEEGS
ncbi:hypothetical protein C1H46_032522 [Malus baccata]|uniref:Uncharacterized protein n=1 Tax=Malus baccata TaxID=106549 RepID=A0A540L6E3_MALBA|nr:hypothetical protein C1H46_032522 [Malus baccata]